MYSHCLFCAGELGRNEVVEAFPVGRRIAFDPAKGRLWVVCRKCERWNLTPLEERWEAFEECERLFRAARMRMSTDHIGLARLSEGLVLVRIGNPLRPEFAAWRYGDQFGRRRNRAMLLATGGVAAAAGVSMGLATVGVSLIGFWMFWRRVPNIPVLGRLRTSDGRVMKLRIPGLQSVRLYRDPTDGSWVTTIIDDDEPEVFRGPEALRAARVILPAANRLIGRKSQVRDAVTALQDARTPERFLNNFGDALPPNGAMDASKLSAMLASQRLALEMALHEEQERQALEGELHQLEAAWREAEEIAAISDDMFVKQEHRDFIEQNRRGEG